MDKAQPAQRSAIVFFQILIVLTAVGALAFLLWEPHLEGRNAHATLFEIYFKDPFLAYAYIGSIAFFVALFQAFRLLGQIGRNRASSPESVRALRIIKYCAITLVAMIGSAVLYLMIVMRGRDDIAGGVAMGLALILISVVAGTAAAVFEKRLRSAHVTR
jgi:hypothetical protein